ncbi:cardiolipin synthase [Thiolapillus sp.]|uniref:cardiolipin synthase n=3 Tax=Thiolapillus sp. TaxID=2017437 RepID=UPI0025F8C75C|nr:cardiolipin synthase [Thiolapillus sp.]
MTLENFVLHPATLFELAHFLIVVGISIRVIMRRPNTGVALSWLMIVAVFPFVGALLYLLIGERRIGNRRTQRINSLRAEYEKLAQSEIANRMAEIDWSTHTPTAAALNRLGIRMLGFPAIHGSRFAFYSDAQQILKKLCEDIDAARESILMEFYIWNEGGTADEVMDAIIRAARRGISCKILIDAMGARPWWKSGQPKQLRDAGVQLREALPVGLFRALVGRTDLRLHRKIVVVDGETAWTGSMNLVDPRFFKQESGVGEWVDAMVRLEGTVVAPLAAVLLGDWSLETGESVAEHVESGVLRQARPKGTVDMQVLSSGPGQTGDGLLQMLPGLVNAAQREIVLTTPYLVPDESLLRALRGAAGRGVSVRLIIPKRVDSLLARYASRSYYDDLLDAGVEIHQYVGGLLHTKSVLVDNDMALFGTVNLDMRSLWLNYEVTLLVFGQIFAGENCANCSRNISIILSCWTAARGRNGTSRAAFSRMFCASWRRCFDGDLKKGRESRMTGNSWRELPSNTSW